jgi:carboxyl-terminal processing protease
MRSLLGLLVSVAALGATPLQAQESVRIEDPSSSVVASVLEEGRSLEASRDWAGALSHYEDALRTHRGDPALLERHDLAKLHYSLGRRYTDRSYLQAVKTLPPREGYELYSELLAKLHTHYVDAPNWRALVERGARALDIALADPTFRQHHLPIADVARIDAFRQHILKTAREQSIRDRRDALSTVAYVAQSAEARLGVKQAAIFLEYAAAAAGGLDDYSAFLTADQLRDTYSQIEGNFVGLGVELKSDREGLLIVNVIKGSPAERAGIQSGDHLTAVDGRSTIGISTDQAANMLSGIEGSVARVTAVTPGAAPRMLSIRREHVEVPSIDESRIADASYGIAYIRLPTFQKTTSRDLEAALWDLHGKGMRHLVLDLRGNPGGLLPAAVEVVDKFVEQGGIVATRGRNPGENFDYTANRVGTWRVPLTVLIDGDSASASEIFAGAIRDHRRGTIIGEASYGKGSVQGIFPLGIAGAGLRLTTAKFYSPNGLAISNVGVTPEIVVQQVARPTPQGTRIAAEGSDAVLDAALQQARQQLAAR